MSKTVSVQLKSKLKRRTLRLNILTHSYLKRPKKHVVFKRKHVIFTSPYEVIQLTTQRRHNSINLKLRCATNHSQFAPLQC